MSPMQIKLEQIFKEYLDCKLFLENETKKIDEKRKEIAEKTFGLNNTEKETEIFFDLMGYLQPLNIDFIQLKTQLYHYYNAYKDFVEIPEELKKELENYDIRYTFSIKNGEKEIVDKDLYEYYKNQQKEVARLQAEYK